MGSIPVAGAKQGGAIFMALFCFVLAGIDTLCDSSQNWVRNIAPSFPAGSSQDGANSRQGCQNKKRILLSAFLAEKWQTQKFGRVIVSSADLCYNGMGDENG